MPHVPTDPIPRMNVGCINLQLGIDFVIFLTQYVYNSSNMSMLDELAWHN